VDRHSAGRRSGGRRRALKRQDHRTRTLVLVIGLTVLGMAAMFVFAYVVARLDMSNFDNQR
jgi:hypothetical protein